MAELLMWSDKGGSFFWACCALNGLSDRGFASVSGLAKQRLGPPGVPGISLMDLMDRWITLTLTNQTPVSALTAGLLGSREAMKTFWRMGGLLWRKGVKKNKGKQRQQRVRLEKQKKKREKEMFGGKGTRERRGWEASILRSPSLHPLAFSSHQRPQGGPNEVKTTST